MTTAAATAAKRPPKVHRGLALRPLQVRDRLLVVGKTGFGKSTFVKLHLQREMESGRRIMFADYQDEYSIHGEENEQRTLGPLLQRITIDELLQPGRAELLDDPELCIAVVMRNDPELAAEDFVELVNLAKHTRDLLFGADEVGMFGEDCPKALHVVATQSRHWGVPLILASQRMVDIIPKARSQASQLVTFHQDNPRDVAAIEELTLSEEFAEAVPSLDVGECLHWRDVRSRRKS